MSDRKDGGGAFPATDRTAHDIVMLETNSLHSKQEREYVEALAAAGRGMSLRDYFAAKAMQGVLSGVDIRTITRLAEENSLATAAHLVSKWAYDQADVMLAEREK